LKSVEDAVDWMLQELKRHRALYQSDVAQHLIGFKDEKLAYYDNNGNCCIGKKVLDLFKRRTPDVVYERSAKSWRQREPYDRPGRLQ